jgi:predicted O-linked N-acetylglucosamine transferase (SPINDLY family)/predicted O-methyltransferase YrrM
VKSFYSSYQTSPAGINTTAALYGIDCAHPERAQVLELGCGKGFHLIRQASMYPQSTFVGIDLDPDKIAQGQQRISEIGIDNVFLYSLVLADLLSIDPGKFDYIIIHEIFSLLDERTRESLLSYCEQHLTPCGIVAVKWNTLPGAQVADTLREAIALHGHAARSEEEKISAAKAMLAYMDMAHTDGDLKRHITEALTLSDAELAVRYVYNKNDACYFSDFNQHVEKSRLCYAGDVSAQLEMAAHYGKDIELVHKTAAGAFNKIASQQYLDFAVNRQIRFSLLISINHPDEIRQDPAFDNIDKLHWAGNYQRRIEANTFYNRQGESLSSDNDLLCRILDIIGDCWPLSVSTAQIIQNTFQPEEIEGQEVHAQQVVATLKALFLKNVPGLYVSLNPSPYNQATSGNLRLIEKITESCWADNNKIELLNGWGESALLTYDEFQYISSGLKITDEYEYQFALELVSKGLLTGSDIAWIRLYQQSMALQDIDIARRRISSLMLFSNSIRNGGFKKDHVSDKKHLQKKSDVLDLRALGKMKSLFVYGNVKESHALLEELIEKYPDSITLLRDAASIYQQMSHFDDALKCHTLGLARDSTDFNFYSGLAQCLSKKSDLFYPKRVAQDLVRKYPAKAEAWDVLGIIYNDVRNSLRYEICARKAVELDTNNAVYLIKLGNVLSERNKMREAREFLKKGVQLSESTNSYFPGYSNMLFVFLHDHLCSQEEIFSEHEMYGLKLTQWANNITLKKSPGAAVKGRTRLRVGFVSGDFRNHPVSNFIYPILGSIDKSRFDIIGYNASPNNDNHTRLYEALATRWHEIQSLSHIELATLIVEDEIDILIDLSGHTAYNRLPVFGLKPAPVQMSWVGYPGTTGIKEMDYYVIDANFAAPGVLDSQFTEKLAYLPVAKKFEPSDLMGAISPLPALDNGYITFGSFNRPQKLTGAVLDCWAKILIHLPKAKLLLASMSDQEMMTHFSGELEKRGVQRNQIITRLKVGFVEYLMMHNEVDVLLDTFPYSGGTTVCHAYGMGVPTLACAGETIVARQSAALMRHLGLNDFIATSEDEYIEKAIAFDKQYEYLNTIRLTMRDRLKEIEQRVERPSWYFEQMLEKAWQQYEKGLPPDSIILSEL